MRWQEALPRRVWGPLLGLLLLSGAVSNMLGAQVPLVQTRTSYGGILSAWGAAYDLLIALGLNASRTRTRLATRDVRRAQWIIAPDWTHSDVKEQLAHVERYAASGGTVVLIGAPSVWKHLGLQGAEPDGDAAAPPVPQGRHGADEDTAAGEDPNLHDGSARFVLTASGAVLRRARQIEVAGERLFHPSSDSGFVARVDSPRGALVVEKTLGRGKIVAIAGRRFLENYHLDEYDHAQLVVDLALAYGPPAFDERCHGLLPDRSFLRALGTGPAITGLFSFGLLSFATLSFLRRWPVRVGRDDAPDAPTLEVFVASLSTLYRVRGRNDPRAVLQAYRAGFLRRFERAAFGRREVSQAVLAARLQGTARRLGPQGKWLTVTAEPRTTAELEQAVAALEQAAAMTKHSARKR